MKKTITMSIKEANRISILTKLSLKEIKQVRASQALGVSIRQVRRLLKKFRKGGARGIIHGLRGSQSNNRVDQKIMETAINVIKDRYPDFSVTLAHEKLVENHSFPYSRETLRAMMVATGLWKPKRQPVMVVHQMRERRGSVGELVQIDGSPHAWFEDRGEYCNLLVYIDDATSKLLWLEFVKSETVNAYFLATKHYLQKHGKPLAFYSDKHGVFRVNTTKKSTASVDDSNGLTQFGRAMRELSIETIFANSPQAKGRVERVNQTLQDRLVKELRLRKLDTMTEANRYLPEFTEGFNRRFAVVPKSSLDLHRPLLPTDLLENILVQKQTRVLSKQLTISYQDKIYQVDVTSSRTNRPSYVLRHAKVEVREDSSGSITVNYKGRFLKCLVIAKLPKVSIVESKHLNQIMDVIKVRGITKPPANHPWRQYAQTTIIS